MKVYLAGPEVFFAAADTIIARKRRLAEKYGFVRPADDPAPFPEGKFESGLHIAAMNERMMREADFIVANMTPFRGISADVGTAYEIGFMCALGKPAFGYSNDPRHYTERAAAEWYAGAVGPAEGGLLRASDGMMVEEHEMADNLMLDGGIALRRGVVVRPGNGKMLPLDDLSMFEACLVAARAYFDARDR